MMHYRHLFLEHLPQSEVCLIPKINHACPTKGRDIFNDLVLQFMLKHCEKKPLFTFDAHQDTTNASQYPEDFSKGNFVRQSDQSDSHTRNHNDRSN